MRSPGEAPREVTVNRSRVTGALPIDLCLVPGTRLVYVMLPTFLDETIDDRLREALTAVTAEGPPDGLILDMRMNGGGLGSVAEATLAMFLGGPQGAFVTRTTRGSSSSRPRTSADRRRSRWLFLSVQTPSPTVRSLAESCSFLDERRSLGNRLWGMSSSSDATISGMARAPGSPRRRSSRSVCPPGFGRIPGSSRRFLSPGSGTSSARQTTRVWRQRWRSSWRADARPMRS